MRYGNQKACNFLVCRDVITEKLLYNKFSADLIVRRSERLIWYHLDLFTFEYLCLFYLYGLLGIFLLYSESLWVTSFSCCVGMSIENQKDESYKEDILAMQPKCNQCLNPCGQRGLSRHLGCIHLLTCAFTRTNNVNELVTLQCFKTN